MGRSEIRAFATFGVRTAPQLGGAIRVRCYHYCRLGQARAMRPPDQLGSYKENAVLDNIGRAISSTLVDCRILRIPFGLVYNRLDLNTVLTTRNH